MYCKKDCDARARRSGWQTPRDHATHARELPPPRRCSDLQEQVQQLLRTYKARYLERLGASAARSAAVSQQDATADFARPVFLAAAFSLVAKWRRAKVDKATLLKKMGVAQRDFAATVEDMTELCAEMQDGNGAAAG